MKTRGTAVTFFRRPDGALIGYRCQGHTGYAEAGEDIVCAAVSALTQSVLYGLTEVVQAPVDYEQRNNGAMLKVQFRPDAMKEEVEKGQVLLRTLLGSLQAIARDYPRNVRISTERR